MTKSACRRTAVAGAFLWALVLFAGLAPGAAHAARAQRYVLTSKSEFQSGCFDPCLCPIFLAPLGGRFYLVPTGSEDGGLFETFAVRGVRWIIGDGSTGARRRVRGSGTYRLGGEVALTQRL